MSELNQNKENESLVRNDISKSDASIKRLPDSAEYLKKLETKLHLLSGKNKGPSAKEMLSLLQAGKEDFMSHLIQVDSNVMCSSYLPEISCDDKNVSQSYLERKIFPEKVALSNEELQHLLEADVLSKSSESLPNSEIER